MSARNAPKRNSAMILLLAVGVFVISTSELLPMGLLLEIGTQLGITVRSAGWLVTAYALGVVIGGPLLTVATMKVPRKHLLLYMLGLFAAGSILSAAAPSFTILVVSRIVSAIAQGAFFGSAIVMASQLASPGKEGAAIALAGSGLTIATVVGGPLGTLLGQQFGWRFPFLMLVVVTLLVWIGIARMIPHTSQMKASGIREQFKEIFRAGPVLALCTTVFGFGGVFLVFTYIAPLLQHRTGLPEGSISSVLLLFGAASVIGNYIGGKLADKRLTSTLIGGMALLFVVMIAFYYTSRAPVPALITIFVWGAAAYTMVTPLNMLVLARSGAAQDLASTLNISAFNLGNAIGAFIGGIVTEGSWGLAGLPIAAAVVVLIGIGFAAGGVLWERSKARLARERDHMACPEFQQGSMCSRKLT